MVKSWVDGPKSVRRFKGEVKLPALPTASSSAGRRGDSTVFKRIRRPMRGALYKEKSRMEQNAQAQEELKAHLTQTNEKFRQLMEQHHEYDRQVETLEAKPTLTADQELEEHRL